jgi:glycosyltransferase involved in cell wall biosynthesis
MRRPLRVAICGDYPEERWPSMDRIAARLVEGLRRDHADAITAQAVCPPFARRASHVSSSRLAGNVDRGLNRLVDYPRHASKIGPRYDIFHVVDHSYAQLVHRLPAERTVVTCHDLDAFRSLFGTNGERRTVAFRAMMRHVLSGLQKAATVTCDTSAIRDELVARALVRADRVVVAPLGVDAVFSARLEPSADDAAARLAAAPDGAVEVLHVGSTVPRKRIDILLRAFAGIRAAIPSAHLVRVGGAFTPDQLRLAGELGVTAHVSVLPPLNDRTLAGLYRRASIVLLPSEREGFGLPLAEALGCGTAVVASDLAPLREVGGDAASYCPVGNADAFAREAVRLVREAQSGSDAAAARRARGIERAALFTWSRYAAQLAGVYLALHETAACEPAESVPCRA